MELEARGYNEDCTEIEKQLILDRVWLEGDLIFYDEVPVMSPYQIELMWKKIADITDPSCDYYMIVNLTNSKPPNAEQRAVLIENIKKVNSRLKHCAVYTGKNKLINLVAKFVIGSDVFHSYNLCKNKEEALAIISDVKNK